MSGDNYEFCVSLCFSVCLCLSFFWGCLCVFPGHHHLKQEQRANCTCDRLAMDISFVCLSLTLCLCLYLSVSVCIFCEQRVNCTVDRLASNVCELEAERRQQTMGFGSRWPPLGLFHQYLSFRFSTIFPFYVNKTSFEMCKHCQRQNRRRSCLLVTSQPLLKQGKLSDKICYLLLPSTEHGKEETHLFKNKVVFCCWSSESGILILIWQFWFHYWKQLNIVLVPKQVMFCTAAVCFY